jgi:hypothetical protein
MACHPKLERSESEGWWEILELNQLPDFIKRCGTGSYDLLPPPDTPASTPCSDSFSQLAQVVEAWPKLPSVLRMAICDIAGKWEGWTYNKRQKCCGQ